MKSLLLGYDVIETTTTGTNVINSSPLRQQQARELAATYEWVKHLDTWMTTLVEDEDIVEEVGEILGLHDRVPYRQGDDEEISAAYDLMTAGALKFLPAGLRKLAELYEKEWESRRVVSA